MSVSGRTGRLRVAAVTAAVLVCSVPTLRAAETVQLASFLVRAQTEDGSTTGTQPITVLLNVSDKKRADYICSVSPRLRDSVVRHLSTQQFILSRNGELMIQGIDAQLRPVMTQALQWDILEEIQVIHGARQVSSKLAQRLNQIGCVRLADDGRRKPAAEGGEN